MDPVHFNSFRLTPVIVIPIPDVAEYLGKQIIFYAFWTFIHTKTQFDTAKNGSIILKVEI